MQMIKKNLRAGYQSKISIKCYMACNAEKALYNGLIIIIISISLDVQKYM